VRKLILGAALIAMVGCAAKPQATATTAAPAADPRNKIIVHIVNQHQTITVTSSPSGLLYSLKDPQGHVQIADATPAKFAELQPQLYQQIKHYIAVHADDAPIPSADLTAPIPSADTRRE
jgi:type IV pilus biogenesis protein CpaD/CtpE